MPFAFAVTTPSLTVATPVSLLLHITFLLLASLGSTVVVRPKIPPFSIVALVLFSVTPVTEVLTVTSQVAVLPPSAVVALIVAVPFAFAVTMPPFTVAT